MVENSKIEWTDHTHNEWIGCAKVSPGCEHCYAETLMDTRYGRVEWGVNGTRVLTSDANRKKPLSWDRAAKKAGIRQRVFCSSLSDIFEDRDELIPWRQRLFHTIDQTPNLDWLILTKRPENVLRFGFEQQLWWPGTGISQNIWIGTSVEDQKRANERIPALMDIPAAVRFLSCEPLLGPVDFAEADVCWWIGGPRRGRINWVIVGGESGDGSRPMHPEWVRSIQQQCRHGNAAFFFKQWGEWSPQAFGGIYNKKASIFVTIDGYQGSSADVWGKEDKPVRMTRVGKKAAGRLLDGDMWNEFPVPVS